MSESIDKVGADYHLCKIKSKSKEDSISESSSLSSMSWRAIWDRAWDHTKSVYVATYITDCLIWPPMQLINFTFIPLKFQFLFVNVVNLGWNTYLSLMANKSHSDPHLLSTDAATIEPQK